MGKDICERTFQFSVRVVRLCRELKREPGVGWMFSKQLFRSGTSIGANVEEGQAAQSRADFASKYSIARKEARETRYWLRLLVATSTVPEDRLNDILRECDELIAILTSIIKKTERPRS
jgi:four helix bundle protein